MSLQTMVVAKWSNSSLFWWDPLQPYSLQLTAASPQAHDTKLRLSQIVVLARDTRSLCFWSVQANDARDSPCRA
jgi:hypothetical protein